MLKRALVLVAAMALLMVGITATAQETSEYIVLGSGANLESQITNAGGTVVKFFPQINAAVVQSNDPNFSVRGGTVVPNFQVSTPDTLVEPDFVSADDAPLTPNTGDDDFFFDMQWGINSVRAQEAWAAGSTGEGVRVFVLDEGFDMTHPDLVPNLNVGLSKSFVPGEDASPAYLLADPFSHGTHVAGTIAAADNGFGVIGVAPDAELVFVKVLSELIGSGAFSWVVEGILYAADNDADVINMSLGAVIPQGQGVGSNEIAALRVFVNRAITYANNNGATVVVSAGNDGLDLNSSNTASLIPFNSFASHAISISAVGPEGWALDTDADPFEALQQAYYTNIGTTVDFAAQGGTVDFNLLASGDLCTIAGLTRPCYVFDFVFSTGNGGWYWSIGTSMAAPHAAGVAALIIGENGGEMKPAHVKAEMRRRAVDLGPRGNDDLFGYGLASSGY